MKQSFVVEIKPEDVDMLKKCLNVQTDGELRRLLQNEIDCFVRGKLRRPYLTQEELARRWKCIKTNWIQC